MSLIKANSAQIGQSNTATQNFTLTTGLDGTAKLARGNAGSTTQDILTVDANGNVLVDGNNLNLFSAKSLASSGYQKLPSGLIIQWGIASSNTAGVSNAFPIAFPTACLSVVATQIQASPLTQFVAPSVLSKTAFTCTSNNGTPAAYYIAIGY